MKDRTDTRPMIGIPLWVQRDAVPRVVVNHAYVRAIDANGGIPILLSPMAVESLPAQLSLIDALLLPGGFDVNPSLYLEEKLPECDQLREDIDNEWYSILSEAVKRRLPILGICRGMQYLNIYFTKCFKFWHHAFISDRISRMMDPHTVDLQDILQIRIKTGNWITVQKFMSRG